jgi:glycosyltransferase involved in cell wall biosynthesis
MDLHALHAPVGFCPRLEAPGAINGVGTEGEKSREKVSFVIPFFNEEAVLKELVSRLEGIRGELDADVEFIFVDDGSADDGPRIVEELARTRPEYKLVSLSRNFGHQPAISAGMQFATGDYVCVLDADLQDPPELAAAMLRRARHGIDVVYAVRKTRTTSKAMQVCYKLYYRLLNTLADIKMPLDAGDFCLMTRDVSDTIARLPEQQRFVRGLRSWVGFKQESIEFSRSDRTLGEAKYSFRSLVRLGLDGIFAFSSKPLRIATYFGLALAAACMCYVIYAFLWRFFSGQSLPGFATIAVGIFFLGAVQLISIGILGEYISRIFYEVKRRPPYVVARRINLD